MNESQHTKRSELRILMSVPEGLTGIVILMAVVLGVVLSLATGKLPAGWLAGMGMFAAVLLIYASSAAEPSLQRR